MPPPTPGRQNQGRTDLDSGRDSGPTRTGITTPHGDAKAWARGKKRGSRGSQGCSVHRNGFGETIRPSSITVCIRLSSIRALLFIYQPCGRVYAVKYSHCSSTTVTGQGGGIYGAFAKAEVRVADEIGAAGDMLPVLSASSLVDQGYVVYSVHHSERRLHSETLASQTIDAAFGNRASQGVGTALGGLRCGRAQHDL